MPGGGNGTNAHQPRNVGWNTSADATNRIHKAAVKKHHWRGKNSKYQKNIKKSLIGSIFAATVSEKYSELTTKYDLLFEYVKHLVVHFGTVIKDRDGEPNVYSLWVAGKDLGKHDGFELSAQPTVDGGILFVMKKETEDSKNEQSQ